MCRVPSLNLHFTEPSVQGKFMAEKKKNTLITSTRAIHRSSLNFENGLQSTGMGPQQLRLYYVFVLNQTEQGHVTQVSQ